MVIRVLVLSHSEIVRLGLGSMLRMQPGVADITDHDNATPTPALAHTRSVDIMIVTAEFGDDEFREIRESLTASNSKILLLLRNHDRDALRRVSAIRADGFMLESELTTAALGNTLTRVLQGDVPMPAFLARELLTRLRTKENEPAQRPFLLTQREIQVLTLVVDGLSNKQIARRLRMSENGTKRHVTSILAKLNVSNRTLAAALVVKERLLDSG
jgi:two-component system, NarL family, nitrate/nitrite response regulator NarL